MAAPAGELPGGCVVTGDRAESPRGASDLGSHDDDTGPVAVSGHAPRPSPGGWAPRPTTAGARPVGADRRRVLAIGGVGVALLAVVAGAVVWTTRSSETSGSAQPGSAAEARVLLQQAKASNAQARAEGREVTIDPHRPPGGEPGYVLSGAAGPRGRGEMGGMPCEIVHCGVGGSNCYANAGLRWLRGWKVCMGIYVPVHLLPRLMFNPKQFTREPITAVTKVLTGSARSASFLATYIASIWFMVCLGRSALLPRLFPSISHRFWDKGLGPLMGSITCGFAIFIEERRKRAEMALYVAPRALYAVVEQLNPGWMSSGYQSAFWAERVTFGIAVGIVVTAARFRPDFLRGVTSLMAWVVKSQVREGRLRRARGRVAVQ